MLPVTTKTLQENMYMVTVFCMFVCLRKHLLTICLLLMILATSIFDFINEICTLNYVDNLEDKMKGNPSFMPTPNVWFIPDGTVPCTNSGCWCHPKTKFKIFKNHKTNCNPVLKILNLCLPLYLLNWIGINICYIKNKSKMISFT